MRCVNRIGGGIGYVTETERKYVKVEMQGLKSMEIGEQGGWWLRSGNKFGVSR